MHSCKIWIKISELIQIGKGLEGSEWAPKGHHISEGKERYMLALKYISEKEKSSSESVSEIISMTFNYLKYTYIRILIKVN